MTTPLTGAPAPRGSVPSIGSRIERFVVFGPDPPEPDRPTPLLGRLLPWPVRLFLIAAVWAVAFVWRASAPARPLAWALVYGGVVAVSLAASVWTILFAINAALGSCWLLGATRPPPAREQRPLTWFALHIVEFLNRQVSHFEAFWIWMAVVLTAVPRIHYQLPLLMAVALLGAPCINAVARFRNAKARKLDSTVPEARKSDGTLQVARRSAIYLATLVGLAIVVLRTHGPVADVLPLALAIGIGVGLRAFRVRLRARVRPDHERLRAFRRAQMRWSRGPDVLFGPSAALAAIAALGALATFGRNGLDGARAAALDRPPPSSGACAPEVGGPSAADIALLLIGDSHAHELGGARFPGQTELADTVGRTALRPVELDVLSAAPIAHFARVFDVLQAANPSQRYWAHLGDFGDLSCTGELERARSAFAAFPPDRFAGIASGNHDVRFTGNFLWSPFWMPACEPGARLDKKRSIAAIEQWIGKAGSQGPGRRTVATPASPWLRWLGGRPGALVTVTPLGTIGGESRRGARGVAAMFIDSTDDQALDWGLAGLFGTFSAAQAERLQAEVLALPARAGKDYADPIWIVFSHNRLEDMAGPSASRLEAFLGWLDRGGAVEPSVPGNFAPAPHLLAFVAAHTHAAEAHRRCLGGRVLRELVIGSTLDPPQQAALLTVGLGADRLPSARLETLPAVARPGLTCGESELMVDARSCRQMLATLKTAPACQPLLREAKPGPDCSALESVPSLGEHLREVALHGGVFEPTDIRREQAGRTRDLMACVCRAGAPGADGPRCKDAAGAGDLLENAAYASILDERRARGGELAERELVCLSWAAAAVQRYKTAGMTFATALRCAFDDRTLPAAQDSVVSLEVTRCR